MATKPRQTCWIVCYSGPHGAESHSRHVECHTLREARAEAARRRNAVICRGYGPASDRGIGDRVA